MAGKSPSAEQLAPLTQLFVLLFDGSVPFWMKLFPIFGLLYGIMPLDLIPDGFPICGQIDDAGVIGISMLIFWLLARRFIKQPPGK